eukprot:TRINITY_DN9647_c0_g1_i1.p1 TRINITY_DN9647_c0_g1~~TRINITY_DN9647_c0_g1_i1.p1  ORF type:complete len:117 (-),score=20.93 TRINITY_DN9647_c0_g1_i1:214-564(-)
MCSALKVENQQLAKRAREAVESSTRSNVENIELKREVEELRRQITTRDPQSNSSPFYESTQDENLWPDAELVQSQACDDPTPTAHEVGQEVSCEDEKPGNYALPVSPEGSSFKLEV